MSTKMRMHFNNDKIVYLVDGSAYIYRAHYGIKGLINSKKQATNAIFGFTRMLIKLLNKLSPKYLAIFFDTKGNNFRHIKHKEYKANRVSMPNDLVEQIPWIKKIINNLGIIFFETEGFEADDLIGTAARIIQKRNLSVAIVTGDKDFIQLINDNCMVLDPFKNELIDKKSVIKKYEINPEQMLDVMGFSGDKADNIPGIPGIGIKTALKLIKKFGNMEKCYKHINDINKEKQKTRLLKFKEQAFLSRFLAKINTYAPINIEIRDLLISNMNKNALEHIFKELEFKQLNIKN